MLRMRHLLLILLVCICSTPVYAEITVAVVIEGLERKLEDNVRLFLSIEQQKDHALLSEGRLQRLHKKATQEIENALQPFGYYRPLIVAELSHPEQDFWQAKYVVDPGPALKIAAINFTISLQMQEDGAFSRLLREIPLRVGEVFNHIDYENFKSSLAKLASERGYFDARFSEHRVEIDLQSYSASIHLNFEGGPRYSFGEVELEQDVLNENFLRRFIPFEKGTPYTVNQLIELQHALNDSDYFRNAEVALGEITPGSLEVPVKVTLTPRRRNHYSFGLGYGTDTGARTKIGWEIPRVNPKGHRFDSEAKLSEIGHSLGLRYRVPVLNPRTDQLIYSAGLVNEETDTSESTIRTIGVSLKRSRGEWRESVSINYQDEDFIVGADRGNSVLLMPGINWTRTWGSDFIYAVDGLRFDIGFRGATTDLVSDTNFFQADGGIKAITSLGSRDRVIARGSLGAIETEQFENLPTSIRFFAGGAQSVRGYAYNSLGQLDSSGEVVGGRYLMVGSLEYEHSLDDTWGLALFYDAGNAIDDLADKLKVGAGFGLRWKSPIGPVRIDLASALSNRGQPWSLHINIGPDL